MFKLFKNNIVLLIIILFFSVIIFFFRKFIPLWDGRTYYDNCLIPAITSKFNLLNFNCFKHTSIAYMLVMSISQYIFPKNYVLLIITNQILGILAIIIFYKTVLFLRKDQKKTSQTYLITAIFAFYPIFLSNLINLNIDYPVMVFFLFYLYFLLSKKFILTILSSILLIFSKETGFIIYFVSLLLYLYIFLIKKPKFNLRLLPKKALFLFTPAIIYVGFVFYLICFVNRNPLWISDQVYFPIIFYILPYDMFYKSLYHALISIFIINFNWIFSLTIISGLFFKKFYKLKLFNIYSKFFFILLILLTYALTRYKTYNNLRYFLSLYPLLMLVFYSSFLAIIKNIKYQTLILSLIFILFLLSNFFTLDPLSKKIFKTFNFGNHEFLRMTSLTNECCGYGRDQLVYNLQYTIFHYIQNIIYADLKPSKNTYLIYQDNVDFFLTGTLDKKTYKRTLSTTKTNTFVPKYINLKSFLRLTPRPTKAFFIDFPNFDIKNPNLNKLDLYYKISLFKKYELYGYKLSAYELILRR